MLKKIISWSSDKLYSMKTRYRFISSDIAEVNPISTVAVDPRVTRAKKIVKEAFSQQQQQFDAMALVPHRCDDPISCKKSDCWYEIPDVIVKTVKLNRMHIAKAKIARKKRQDKIFKSKGVI